ncbi:MAG: hypothetical protein U0835_26205, partial [Isosphaeraceae bacterium]
MASVRLCVIGLGLFGAAVTAASAAPVGLAEKARPGTVTRVEVSLTARGEVKPGTPRSLGTPAPRAKGESSGEPKDLAYPLKSEVKLDYIERVLKVDERERPTRVARRARRAATAVNVGPRPTVTSIRGAVALLAASRVAGELVIHSPLGPLTRPELDILETPGDPLTLPDFLPDRPVEKGDRWKLSDAAVKTLSSYDTILSSTVDGRVELVDADHVIVRLHGEIRGTRAGGEGTIACEGSLTFDRKNQRVEKLNIERAEVRRAGLVEEGLDVRSTLNVVRKTDQAPPEL